jgi:hypothetical protein
MKLMELEREHSIAEIVAMFTKHEYERIEAKNKLHGCKLQSLEHQRNVIMEKLPKLEESLSVAQAKLFSAKESLQKLNKMLNESSNDYAQSVEKVLEVQKKYMQDIQRWAALAVQLHDEKEKQRSEKH